MNHKGVTPWIRENWKMKVLILEKTGKLKIYTRNWDYWKWSSKRVRRIYHDKS